MPRSDPAQSVTLSLTEYNRLMRSRQPAAASAALAPVGAMLLERRPARPRRSRQRPRRLQSGEATSSDPESARVHLLPARTLIEGTYRRTAALPLDSTAPLQSALLPGPGPLRRRARMGHAADLRPGRASSSVLPAPQARHRERRSIDLPGEQADVHALGWLHHAALDG